MLPPWINLVFPFGLCMTLSSGLVKGNEASLYFAFLLSCSRRYPPFGTVGVREEEA